VKRAAIESWRVFPLVKSPTKGLNVLYNPFRERTPLKPKDAQGHIELAGFKSVQERSEISIEQLNTEVRSLRTEFPDGLRQNIGRDQRCPSDRDRLAAARPIRDIAGSSSGKVRRIAASKSFPYSVNTT
jgi:hypothetical protein